MVERGTRWERSVLTFGLPGRLLATVLLLAPLWLFWQSGIYGLVGLVIWVWRLLPWALADVWRPAVLPSTDLTRLRDAARREAELARRPPAAESRPEPPKRW